VVGGGGWGLPPHPPPPTPHSPIPNPQSPNFCYIYTKLYLLMKRLNKTKQIKISILKFFSKIKNVLNLLCIHLFLINFPYPKQLWTINHYLPFYLFVFSARNYLLFFSLNQFFCLKH